MKRQDKINELERQFEERTGVNFQGFYKINKPKLMWYISKFTKDTETAIANELQI